MEDVEAPRRLRYSKEDSRNMSPRRSQDGSEDYPKSRREKKRRREKHQRYSPELLASKKHKKKKKNSKLDNLPRIKIKIKAIPNPTGGGVSSENTQMFVASSDIDLDPLVTIERKNFSKTQRTSGTMTECATCGRFDENKNLVMCDDCQKSFHFGCLDPPLKKSPKMRGYSWHCADCDPTAINKTLHDNTNGLTFSVCDNCTGKYAKNCHYVRTSMFDGNGSSVLLVPQIVTFTNEIVFGTPQFLRFYVCFSRNRIIESYHQKYKCAAIKWHRPSIAEFQY